jgi:myo-inositol-1(or 4)-monophosphatase
MYQHHIVSHKPASRQQRVYQDRIYHSELLTKVTKKFQLKDAQVHIFNYLGVNSTLQSAGKSVYSRLAPHCRPLKLIPTKNVGQVFCKQLWNIKGNRHNKFIINTEIMDRETTRDAIMRALHVGGKILMKHFGNIRKVKIKESNSSILTEADLASDKAIQELLNDLPEKYNLITEETGFIDNHSGFTWVIDPLDGTSNFAAGLPWFGILIALFKGNQPVQAGMYLPVEDQLYFAEKGAGARKNNLPILVSNAGKLKEVLIGYSFDHSRDPGKTASELKLIGKLSGQVRNIRSTNSLYDFCCVADGRLGATINQTTKIWDIAAPWLVIKEAGGRVCDINGREHVFSVSEGSFGRNFTIVASCPLLYKELLTILTGI